MRLTVFLVLLLTIKASLLFATSTSESSSTPPRSNNFQPEQSSAHSSRIKSQRNTQSQQHQSNANNDMGQALRMISYDYSGNRLTAVSALRIADHHLKWHRLDDGVMGGMSSTNHQTVTATSQATPDNDVLLHFTGTINTQGGGFCSVRSDFPMGLLTGTYQDLAHRAIRVCYRGDGKTYKVLLTNNTRGGGPMSPNPSWQVDLPTTKSSSVNDDEWEERIIPLTSFLPSFGGGRPRDQGLKYELHPNQMKEIGLMLSLKLSDGRPNPVETFGQGIFPFSLHVKSIEFLDTSNNS